MPTPHPPSSTEPPPRASTAEDSDGGAEQPGSPASSSQASGEPSPLDHLLAAWPDPALVADRSGRVCAVNAAARYLLRIAADDVRRLDAILGAEDAAALAAADGEPVERVVLEDAPEGRGFALRARAAPLGPDRVVVCLSDASGETRLRRHLGLAEKLASIGELLSSVAHELSNPLTTVLGYADLLLSEDDPGLPRTELERIREEALRCRRIVGNLLDLARTEALDLKPVLLSQVVDKVVEFRAYACNSAGVELRSEVAETPVVLGDFHRLVQAVLNLVTNAEDAVRGRDQPRRVTVRTGARDGHAIVEVDDNGEGVADAVKPFVFQPFFTTKPRGKGTGLGLSLVRTTARQHRGDVHAEDAPDGGARFVMTIPAAG